MSHRTLIGNLFTGLSAGTVGTVLQDFCTACSKGDKVAIASILGGLTGGPLLAVGLLAGGVGLQVWGQSREAKKQRERYAELAAKIAACKDDTQQLIDLVEPIADHREFVQARLPGYEKADLAQWVAKEVKKTLAPLLPDDAKPIDWDVLRIYIESNKAILDDLRAIATETRDNTAEVLDILKTGRARLPGIPEGVQNNLALAGIRPNADFEGRRNLIERVHEALSQSQTAALAHALSAEGGVGKTEIAIAYVFDAEYAKQWDGVWWLDASTGALDGSLATTLDDIGYQRRKGDDAEALRRELVRRLGDGRHLVVLDNVDHRSTLENFAVGANTRVLATTRLAPERIPPNVAQAIPVDLLDEAEATAVLLKHRTDLLDPDTGTIAAEHAGAVAGILDELDGHALAVALCAAALRTDTGLSPEALLTQLRANELEAKGHALEHVEADATGRKYGLKVAASLLLLLPGVQAEHPLAAELLLAASLVHPSKIPFSLLVAATGADEAEARRAILALRDRSIVRFDASAGVEGKGLVSVHRLTQSAVRTRVTSEAMETAWTRAIEALNRIFNYPDQHQYWPTQGESLPHALDALHNRSGGSRPTWRLFNQAAFYLVSIGRTDAAEPLYIEALDRARKLFTGNHPDIAQSLNNLAHALHELGHAAEAESLLIEALEIRQKLFDRDHPDIAASLNNLAAVRQSLGRAAEAEPLFIEALEIHQKLFDGDHPDIAASLNNLAAVRESLGRAVEAEPLFVKSLEMRRNLFEHDHPALAQGLNNLGFVRHVLGRTAEAKPVLIEALEMRQRLFDGVHPDVAETLNNLASVRQALGHHADALSLYTEALKMRQQMFEGDHPDIAASLNNLAVFFGKTGELREALQFHEQAVAMGRRCMAVGHPDLKLWEANLAAIRKHIDGR